MIPRGVLPVLCNDVAVMLSFATDHPVPPGIQKPEFQNPDMQTWDHLPPTIQQMGRMDDGHCVLSVKFIQLVRFFTLNMVPNQFVQFVQFPAI